MSGRPEFRADLYRGTASFYDRFRLPYPDALVDDLLRRTSVRAGDRLLDLACGPGTVTFALAEHFGDVWAVDQEPEAIEFASRKADARALRNVRWLVGRAEDVDPDERFDVVTIGTAFHRLDRRRVAALARHWLRSGGHLALLWSDTPLNGPAPWQRVVAAALVDWIPRVGADDRLPATWADDMAEHPHATVLEDAGFAVVGRYEFAERHDWDLAGLIGVVYSTSLLPLAVLGDRAAEFEADLAARLGAVEPSGIYRENATFAYDLAVPRA